MRTYRFAVDYLGVKLHWYQIAILHFMELRNDIQRICKHIIR